MAVQSHHDVVNQSLSADAPSSADVSAFNATSLAARAADDLASQPPTQDESSRCPHDDASRSASVAPQHNGLSAGTDRLTMDTNESVALEEETRRSIMGEGSVGSDTDNSKAEAFGTGAKDGDSREHQSRNAIKKSASFKPVSVTKSFLAKAGSGSAPTKSTNGSEKTSNTPGGGSLAPSSQSTPRPRLVAKSISGQKGALPRASSASGQGGQNGAPDPNQVWNKNRVQVATATPKHLTDEELRQQYGIQLASRPLEDADSNQAKWADIDDEDDDWAPETIEWNDGTKINLAETAANSTPENHEAEDSSKASKPEAESERKGDAPATQAKTSSIGPNPTVLKLGASSQQKPAAPSPKPATDKPTLVAKPMAPTPVKSPWATLPPVERVPPVQINPPVQNVGARFTHRDAHGFDSIPPPAKEIEADDFSRFRDPPNGNQRELYVPHSGRYEPVNDARRGSLRKDGNFRQPAVLQRPSPADRDQVGPAEPSPAFQTNRSQQENATWSRRRGSSGGSVDNGRFGRRMSVGRSQDARSAVDTQGRRGSQFEGRDPSPSYSHGIPATSQSPVISNATEPDLPNTAGQVLEPQKGGDLPGQTLEDAVAMQKRLMREKREAAIKRRQEEEARQEAERRERIRQKLEKLGMSTDNKPAEKKPAEPEPKSKEPARTASPGSKKAPKESKEVRPVLATSPPKPPIPSPSGEPQQYGLMKVHAPQPAPGASPRGSHVPARPSPNSSLAELKPATRGDAKSNSNNGDAAARAADMLSSRPDSSLKETSTDSRSWSNIQSQSSGQFANWGPSTIAAQSPPSGNLWGPPTSHRALGNGDFQSNIQRASLKQTPPTYSSPTTSNPQPIGTPRHFSQASPNAPVASSNKSELLAGAIIEDLQSTPAYPSEADAQTRVQQVRADASSGAPGPSSQHVQTLATGHSTTSQPQPFDQAKTSVAAWNHFSQTSGRLEAEQAAQEHAARMAEQQLGLSRPPALPTLNETWKQVKRHDGQVTRQVINTSQMTNNYAPSVQHAPSDFNKAIGAPTAAPPARSRYQDIFDHHHRSAASTPSVPRSTSPIYAPPPETTEHPVYGIGQRPLVNLPNKPTTSERTREPLPQDSWEKGTKVAINLPSPKEASASPAVPTPPPVARQMSYSHVVKITTTPSTNWQDRFNTLLHRESKVASPPVLSATKPHFDVAPAGTQTAVSLPAVVADSTISSSLTSSAEEEESLFEEERAFGSTPTIRVPPKATMEPWTMAPTPDYKKLPPRTLRDDQVITVRHELLLPGEDLRHPNSVITINILGMSKAQTKPFSRKQQGSQRAPRPNNRSKPRPTGKGREASHGQTRAPSNSNDGPASASSTPAPPKGKSAPSGRHTSYNRRTPGVAT